MYQVKAFLDQEWAKVGRKQMPPHAETTVFKTASEPTFSFKKVHGACS